MLTVWIHSPSVITSQALAKLVSSFGYKVTFQEDSADVALWLLPQHERPYPPAPSVPTLLLLPGGGNAAEVKEIFAKGYRAVLRGYDDKDKLKEALAALDKTL